MPPSPFALVTPATRGLSLAITRQLLLTTRLPVVATFRSGSPDDLRRTVLDSLKDDVDAESRLHPVKLDLLDESSIASAAESVKSQLGHRDAHLQMGWFTGGVLYPEKQPKDLDLSHIEESFRINVISHLLLIKHFSQFLPSKSQSSDLAKWVHISARVGSITQNAKGGWYSYRASKAALNQVVKSFDLQIKMRGQPAIAVGVHPGTVKTDLSKDFWESVDQEKLFEPEKAAEMLVGVVNGLGEEQRGRIWDYKGEEVPP
ncbi:NAD(P)-binding protein [Exidia glandulosa HHB12029]|uniref:NAD(P)-binding protein n=1 Tax=Exidia glandulosa HHB12029 TaxID=1314781 RepID=A0A165DTN9_EXIGL|nr:NAD(P)-binding protein [Exidia glandulosa HHB12029]